MNMLTGTVVVIMLTAGMGTLALGLSRSDDGLWQIGLTVVLMSIVVHTTSLGLEWWLMKKRPVGI